MKLEDIEGLTAMAIVLFQKQNSLFVILQRRRILKV